LGQEVQPAWNGTGRCREACLVVHCSPQRWLLQRPPRQLPQQGPSCVRTGPDLTSGRGKSRPRRTSRPGGARLAGSTGADQAALAAHARRLGPALRSCPASLNSAGGALHTNSRWARFGSGGSRHVLQSSVHRQTVMKCDSALQLVMTVLVQLPIRLTCSRFMGVRTTAWYNHLDLRLTVPNGAPWPAGEHRDAAGAGLASGFVVSMSR
jgi:hypothetical protein